MKLFFKQTKGFTVIEALVSAMIVSIVILGPLSVAIQASSYARQTKDTMIAIYLAQEAVELLRHQQDSVYLRCASAQSSECSMISGELPREAAWRLFKERIGGNAQGVSCFSVDNTTGCAYDFIDLTANEGLSPTKYLSTAAACSTLSINSYGLYVCTGAHGGGGKQTNFSRNVVITSVPTFGGADAQYNDDLRVTVTITFKRTNGYTKQINVVDFLHARS